MAEPSPELGIVCRKDPELLRQHCEIVGLQALDPEEALAAGCGAYEWGAVVPTDPREATDDDVRKIIAGPDTRWPLHMLIFPPGFVADVADNVHNVGRMRQTSDRINYTQITEGLSGVIVEAVQQPPNLATTTCNSGMPRHPTTGEYRRLGLHFDVFEEIDTSDYRVMGIALEEPRKLCIVLGITRESLGSPPTDNLNLQRVFYEKVVDMGDAAEGVLLRVDGPDRHGNTFGYVGFPACEVPHDVSTWGTGPAGSTAVLGSVDMQGSNLDSFESLV